MTSRGGLLLLDKPPGPTSHDLVYRVRKALQRKRVGHGGTLDPMASGLLPLVVGTATRLVRFLPASPKNYEGTLRLGLRTSSDDVTGETLNRHDGPLPPAPRVVEEALALTGRYDQAPPTVSARKVGGQRLYKLARRGIAVEAPPRPVHVERFDLEPTAEPDVYRFQAIVSGGTYIRSLARDLGSRLECGGTLASLRRTRIGPLEVSAAVAVSPEEAPDPRELEAALLPLEAMPLELPTCRIDSAEEAARFRAGAVSGPEIEDEGPFRVIDPDGLLLGIAEGREGRLQPRVVIPEAG